MTVAKTAAEWQALLDEKFPQGAIVSPVLRDGSLSDTNFLCPVLVVVAMRGEWPLIVGIGGDGLDVQLHTATWTEIDRHGHYVARTRMAPVTGARRGEYEISSWLSPALVEALAPFQEPQRAWLMSVAESAEEEVGLELDASPEDVDPERAPSAEPAEDMSLTLTHI